MTLIDYRNFNSRKIFRYDFCIVGAGVSGIIVANEIIRKFPKKRICIVESGNFKISNLHNNSLKRTFFNDLPIKYSSREFTVGGSSSTWGGLTSHFTKDEFSQWPIDYSVLVQNYKKASRRYDFINTLKMKDKNKIFRSFNKKPFCAYHKPINYKKFLIDKYDLIYNAHAICIKSEKNNVQKIIISNSKTFLKSEIHAEQFVLASGAIETIKLLKNSLKKNALTIGIEKKLLGKYFMNHPRFQSGILKLKKRNSSNFFEKLDKNTITYFGISLSTKIREIENLLNPYVRISPIKLFRDDYLVNYFLNVFFKIKNNFKNIFRFLMRKDFKYFNIDKTGMFAQNQYKKFEFKSIFILFLFIFFKLIRYSPTTTKYALISYLEMAPNKLNKAVLSNQKDLFGNFVLEINYSLSPKDKLSLLRLHEELAEYLSTSKLGEVNYNLKLNQKWDLYYDSSHHLGGTIMGNSPNDSFVDKNLKVHSLNNLRIASGSVFPSSGSHNPTYTLAALSINLVENLN